MTEHKKEHIAVIKSFFTLLLPLAALLLPAGRLAAAPTAAEVMANIRPDHPRLFLTRETIPAVRRYAATVARADLERLLAKVNAYPENPELRLKPEVAEVRDGRLVFKKKLNDQDAVVYAYETDGGREAAAAALAWVLTGEEKYRQKALRHLAMLTEFCRLSEQFRILPEWYHYGRMNGILAYDWLYDTLTEQERRDFIVPMLRHVRHMQDPGYRSNRGGPGTGNYGEPGLQWYAGVAAYRDGLADEAAETLLRDGLKLNCEMMALRDRIAAGSGLLSSICTAYSFGAYPWSSFHFLHTLRSAAGFDGAAAWTQMCDFGHYFAWMLIPGPDGWPLDYGWGDSYHRDNRLSVGSIYSHLAQAIHFYPEKKRELLAAMALLPESERELRGVGNFPFLPFILTGFDRREQNTESPESILGADRAAFFPSFGLAVMRSGVTNADTFAAIKAGARFQQHQHYDENSFIIYKRGFQALDSGSRGSAKHHLAYYPQTVAHNAILIRTPDEPLPAYWYPANAPKITETLFNDGGQAFMLENRNLGFEQSARHAVTGGDATLCYAKEKCREAIRQFVYIAPDYFVVYDRVESVAPEQEKLFLLHFQEEPRELDAARLRAAAGAGALFVHTLLPERPVRETVGGPGNEFRTNGRNWPLTDSGRAADRPDWPGRYRLEVKAPVPANRTNFLHLLQAAEGGTAAMVPARLRQSGTQDGVEFTAADGSECLVLFNRDGVIGGHLSIRRDGKTVLDRPLLAPSDPVRHPAGDARPGKARIDATLSGGRLELLDRGDAITWEQPQWLDRGRGSVAEFRADGRYREGEFVLRSVEGGELALRLMGPDVKVDGKRVPRYVEFARLEINGVTLLDAERQPAKVWHDQAKTMKLPVKAGETLRVRARFRTAAAD